MDIVEPTAHDAIHVLYWSSDEDEYEYEVSEAVPEPRSRPNLTASAPIILTPRVQTAQPPVISEPGSFNTTQRPIILIPRQPAPASSEVQVMTRGQLMREQEPRADPPRPTSPARPALTGDVREETVREDDDVLRQLRSTQARISIWSLLAASTRHREALMRALSRIPVDSGMTPQGLVHMVTADRPSCIVFSDADLPLEGADHGRALYITVMCSGRRIPSVLIDNGSALNVCPFSTAVALGFSQADLTPSVQTIRAYDSTRREILGTLTLEVTIGPATFSVLFQVLRIPASFNLLLGRPWIHASGAIPSSLHQMVKFRHDDQVVTVPATGGAHPPAQPILEISPSPEESDLAGFSFEEPQILEVGEISRDRLSIDFARCSGPAVMQMMRRMQYMPGLGLGRRQQGRTHGDFDQDSDIVFGLGFIPTPGDRQYMLDIRRQRSAARAARRPFDYPIRPYTLRLEDYFCPSAGYLGPLLGALEDIWHLLFQISLSDPVQSCEDAVTPILPSRDSMMSVCFPMEDGTEGCIDWVLPGDDYIDEVMMIEVDLLTDHAGDGDEPMIAVEDVADEPLAPGVEPDDVSFSDVSHSLVVHDAGVSRAVDSPFYLDMMSGLVTRDDDVLFTPSMDMTTFEYSHVSPIPSSVSDSIPCTHRSPTACIHVINDSTSPGSREDILEDLDEDLLRHFGRADPDELTQRTADEYETVDLGTAEDSREIRIGMGLSVTERDGLMTLLRDYLDVFAWSYEDMPGLDPSIVQHRIPVRPGAKPTKQKLRRLQPRWSLQVKDEIQKLLSVGFIRVVQYPEWLANVVPVSKKDGKVRVCVDF
ncbi:hypothetical protein KN825_14270 [Weizmannia coagulans]|nr:hypothetical protein [Heyndrickxia coagulans]